MGHDRIDEADHELNLQASVQGREAVHLKRFDNAVEISPTPIADTKNPTMRAAASIPMGPIFRVSLSALARQR